MTDLLHHYADYGLWAGTRFVERLMHEPDEVLDRAVGGSFPTLRATLLHIRDAENTWWGRLTGTPTSWPAVPDTSLDTVLPMFQRFHAVVTGMDAGTLSAIRAYTDLKGREHQQPTWQMVLHCINHGTQHRGQLITQMRQLGLGEIPANDLVVYQRTLTTETR